MYMYFPFLFLSTCSSFRSLFPAHSVGRCVICFCCNKQHLNAIENDMKHWERRTNSNNCRESLGQVKLSRVCVSARALIRSFSRMFAHELLQHLAFSLSMSKLHEQFKPQLIYDYVAISFTVVKTIELFYVTNTKKKHKKQTQRIFCFDLIRHRSDMNISLSVVIVLSI